MKIKLAGNFATKQIWINGKELNPHYSQSVRNHSPDGFNWSYGGSGPAQLASLQRVHIFPGSLSLTWHNDAI